MKNNVLLVLIGTTLAAIAVRFLSVWLYNTLGEVTFIGSLIKEIMPLLSTAASLIVGIGLGKIYFLDSPLFAKAILYCFFVFLSVSAYMSNYYFNYNSWDKYYSKKAKISITEAHTKIEEFLAYKTHENGFKGYLKYVAAKEPGDLDTEDADGLLDILVPLMLRFFQWLSTLFHVQIAGLIEMIFWYLFSWIWIGVAASTMEPS